MSRTVLGRQSPPPSRVKCPTGCEQPLLRSRRRYSPLLEAEFEVDPEFRKRVEDLELCLLAREHILAAEKTEESGDEDDPRNQDNVIAGGLPCTGLGRSLEQRDTGAAPCSAVRPCDVAEVRERGDSLGRVAQCGLTGCVSAFAPVPQDVFRDVQAVPVLGLDTDRCSRRAVDEQAHALLPRLTAVRDAPDAQCAFSSLHDQRHSQRDERGCRSRRTSCAGAAQVSLAQTLESFRTDNPFSVLFAQSRPSHTPKDASAAAVHAGSALPAVGASSSRAGGSSFSFSRSFATVVAGVGGGA